MDHSRSTLARRRQARTPARPLKPIIISVVSAISVFVSIFFLITLRPQRVSCVTTENTYCLSEWNEHLSQLERTSFWRVPSRAKTLEAELSTRFPAIASVEVRRTATLGVQVVITQARALFPIQLNGKTYEVRENGLLTQRDLDLPLIPELENASDVQDLRLSSQKWTNANLLTLETLQKDAQYFSPRIKKILLVDATKVVLYPEGHGSILIHVSTQGELARQMSTLQAFFRSSTMKDTYQELDVRFDNLVVKE